MATTEEHLTTRQAAELWGVTPGTVRRWAKSRKVTPVYLPSGALRFRRSEVGFLNEAPGRTERAS